MSLLKILTFDSFHFFFKVQETFASLLNWIWKIHLIIDLKHAPK